MWLEKLYATLLHLYPAAFREEYERELRAAFRRRWRDEPGAAGRALLWFSVFADTVVTAFEEHAAMFMQDVRYSLRGLDKNRAFAAAVVATLALGIGATTAVYSLVQTVLLRPLPYAEPDRLVRIWETNLPLHIPEFSASLLNVLSWQERSRSFEALAAIGQGGVNLTSDGEPERVTAQFVSATFWQITGLAPALGRAFSTEEDVPGQDSVALLSEGLWRRRYGGDAGVIGRSILVDGAPRTVVGIAPQDAGYRSDVDLWMPLSPNPARENRGNHVVTVIGKLKPGVSIAQATSELNTVAESLEREFPDSNKGWRTRMATVKDWIVDLESRTNLYVLLAAAGLLLLVACSNVAGLLVTRATARHHELGIRMALGASRTRLLRQLITESLVLAVIGGGFGILMASGAVRWLAAVVPNQLPRSASLSMTWPVTMFGVALTLAAGLVFGLAPAWLVRRRGIQPALHEGGRGATVAGSRLRMGLIGTQIAMAAMLVVGALLLIQSFVRLQKVDLGFQPDHLLTARIRLPQPKYDSNEKAGVFFRSLLQGIESLPGVMSAGLTSSTPLGLGNTSMPVVPVERPASVPERGIQALWRMVTPDYLRTLKLPLRRGRLFASRDSGRPEIVLSESLVRQLWPDRSDPLERKVRLGNQQEFTVVGVVGDARLVQMNAEPVGTMYYEPLYLSGLTLVVRTHGDPAAFAPSLREAVHRLDPDQPLDNIRTMDRVIEQSTERPYLQAVLFGCFAAVALLLGAVGVAGVVAHTVERRRRELAVRLALGATSGQAMRAAASGGLTAAVVGLGIGLAGAWGLGRFLSTLLYRVRPDDPLTFTVVGAALLAVAVLACWLPARRVTRIDPLVALRIE